MVCILVGWRELLVLLVGSVLVVPHFVTATGLFGLLVPTPLPKAVQASHWSMPRTHDQSDDSERLDNPGPPGGSHELQVSSQGYLPLPGASLSAAQ